MTIEQATTELKHYKQYTGNDLPLKDSPDKREKIQTVFIGPSDPNEFGKFFELFLQSNHSTEIINSFSDSDLTIYFLVDSGDEDFSLYIRLDDFKNTYLL